MNLKEEIFYGTNKKFIEVSKLYHPIDENLNYSKELLTDIKFRRSYFIEGCEYQLKEQDDYAIEFAEWCDNEGYTQVNNLSLWKSLDDEQGKYSKQLLEIFKKEKGL